MNTFSPVWAVRVGLVLGIGFSAFVLASRAADGDGARPTVFADADFHRLVSHAVQRIENTLADKPSKKNLQRARIAAVMIAVYAQHGQNAVPRERATLRDAALR